MRYLQKSKRLGLRSLELTDAYTSSDIQTTRKTSLEVAPITLAQRTRRPTTRAVIHLQFQICLHLPPSACLPSQREATTDKGTSLSYDSEL